MSYASPTFRRARAADVPDIVRTLADDPLGAARERYASPLPESYARAGERGCHMVQLTTDKTRPDAKRFYESLGFVASQREATRLGVLSMRNRERSLCR